jgi:hypothetical protein
MIKLGSQVVVSDPCYTNPTWCQAVVDDVKPGNYKVFLKEKDLGDWGVRPAVLMAVHTDFLKRKLNWKRHPSMIGVDSGQAGIFSSESYRNDEKSKDIRVDHSFSLYSYDEDGDKWYEKMCRLTLSEDSWGQYSEGVVSSSGLGDGSYALLVAKFRGKVVGFCVDFGIDSDDEEEEYFIDTEFFRKELIEN